MTFDIPKLLGLLGIQYQKTGREYNAKCPIHLDKSPSFHIEESTGRFYCFGCATGGSPISLLMNIQNISKSEALDWLRANGVILDSSQDIPDAVQIAITEPAFSKTFKMAPGCRFGRHLESWPTPVRRYVESRGIESWQVDRWTIGYALEGRLRNRIVFPIADGNGTIHSYSARSFVGENPKYTTPGPHECPRHTVLFGERYWPDGEINASVVLTEGAINALACERAGALYIAALGGSPMTPLKAERHTSANVSDGSLIAISKLAKFERVIVATDPDQAGEKVAYAIKSLGRWTNITQINFEPNTDAASIPLNQLRTKLLNAKIK